ncbi:MAG: hypothetical protein Q9171_000544 [Xanthocarpia ochracea]
MEHFQGSIPLDSVDLATGFAEPSTRPNEEGNRIPSPAAEIPRRSIRLGRQLSTRGQQVKDEMKQRALEAQAHLYCEDDSDSSEDDTNVRTMAPSFTTKRLLPLKQVMPTITEEGQTYTVKDTRTIRVTIRSNSVHTRTNVQSGRLPELVNQTKLEARIAEIDHYLDEKDLVQPCYRERLWKIRAAFDDLRAHRIPRDTPESLNTLNLDLEVQVACLAQANVKRFTHLLLHANVGEDMKVQLRRYLAYSETLTNPRLDENTNLVLDWLKRAAASIDSGLENIRPETLLAAARTKELTLRRDVDELGSLLQDFLSLRYNRNQDPPRLSTRNLKPLGQYIRLKVTRDKNVAISLAKKLGLHPIELDYAMQDRLDNLLRNSNVDSEYVEARLCDLNCSIWHWVNGYNPLAHKGQWTKLAGQFCEDRAQFHKIFPGDLIYIDPERGISRSNAKARVSLGMMTLHTYYFAKLQSSNVYKLSKTAKKMDKSFVKVEQKRLKEMETQQMQRRAPKPRSNAVFSGIQAARLSLEPDMAARLKKWVDEVKDGFKTRNKSKYPEEKVEKQ